MSIRTENSFDIQNFTSILQSEKKGSYICPNCNAHQLTIAKDGKYNCWNCKDTKAIARILTEPEREERQRQWEEANRVEGIKTPDERKQEWTVGSGVPESITEVNLRHTTDSAEMVAQLLGWKWYRGVQGWYVLSCDPVTGKLTNRGQFKPDEEIVFPDKDPGKYLSFPKRSESEKKTIEAIYLVTALMDWQKISDRVGVPIEEGDQNNERDDLGFWAWVIKHPEIPIVITEGAKKAACLLGAGWVSICLTGVDGGADKGTKLIPSLAELIVPGRPVFLGFDADIVEKVEVRRALIKVSQLIKQQDRTSVIRVAQWELSLGKGIDDVVAEHGVEALETIMNSATPYGQWLKSLERQFQNSSSGDNSSHTTGKSNKSSIPTVTKVLAEKYRSQLAYSNTHLSWMEYTEANGVWVPITDVWMEGTVRFMLEAEGVVLTNSYSIVTNAVKYLRDELRVHMWTELDPRRYIPFLNGVLDMETKELLPHQPGYRFLWCIPRNYDSLATDLGVVGEFLNHLSENDLVRRQLLLAFVNATLKGRSDLQRCLFLLGEGGTGKGTFQYLLTELVGQQNVWTGDFQTLAESRFVFADIAGKRVALFPDEQKATSNLSRFYKLTGGDLLQCERKGKDKVDLPFHGMVVVAGNKPIFAGDSTSATKRRVIIYPCRHPIPALMAKQLHGDITLELSALINEALKLSDGEVTAILKDGEASAEIQQAYWEAKIRTDSIAAWVNDCLINSPDASAAIGNDKDDTTKLFGNYNTYCRQNNYTAKSSKNFSPDLLEILAVGLGWQVSKVHSEKGNAISGVRLRSDKDTLLFIDGLLAEGLLKVAEGLLKGGLKCQDVDTASNLDKLKDKLSTNSEKKESEGIADDEVNNGSEGAKISADPSAEPGDIQDKGSDPSGTPSSNPSGSTNDPSGSSTPPSNPTGWRDGQIFAGDRVQVSDLRSEHFAKHGVMVAVTLMGEAEVKLNGGGTISVAPNQIELVVTQQAWDEELANCLEWLKDAADGTDAIVAKEVWQIIQTTGVTLVGEARAIDFTSVVIASLSPAQRAKLQGWGFRW